MQTIAHLARRLAVVTAAVPLLLLGGTVSASARRAVPSLRTR